MTRLTRKIMMKKKKKASSPVMKQFCEKLNLIYIQHGPSMTSWSIHTRRLVGSTVPFFVSGRSIPFFTALKGYGSTKKKGMDQPRRH